ncbi:hypothetical protein SAMN04487972_11465 [Paracoccus halophilus]|uniref:Nickel/cobalt transporter regulator n=1 Tax=Paracoccus halophilus TaxID=376733 RepID=A0A099F101_9RHOB|nr:hypothetical protein [Paracoccus halophilus]KGJ04114.1 hypothetical protein IT41_11420 [Paracoccus halophilus]SFA55984.1 hypothetical protein SAMN04487972_11465 [Paracoccus halophilus]
MFRHRLEMLVMLGTAAALGSAAMAEQAGLMPQPADDAAAQAIAPARGGLQVGQIIDGGGLHRVSRPGLYGMSQPPAGSAYGIMDDRLIRFDPESGRVLSIIRQVEQILD